MNKKNLAVIAGTCTIIGAVTAASRKPKWQDVHKFAAVVGALVTLTGLTR